MNYPPYPKYKPSDVEWLGEVPAHWQLKRLKYIASHNDDALPETTDPDYVMQYVDISSVTFGKGIEKTEEFTFEKAPSRARRKVKDGDTIVSTVRTYLKAIASIEKPAENLVVSTGFAVVHPRAGILPRYLAYQLQTDGFVNAVVANSSGVSYPAINASLLVTLPVLVPGEDEQRAIAAFLDRETARIDALIAKKQRLIELLAEKRTALISHAVTKGLNPDVPMKDSGVEWLGEIPAHWEEMRLKNVADIQVSNVDKKSVEGQEPVRLCNYVDVYYHEQITPDISFMEATATRDQIKKFGLRKGDVLITKDSETPDDIAVPSFVADDLDGVVCGYHLAQIRSRTSTVDGRYLARTLAACGIKDQFYSTATGITRFGLSRGDISGASIPVPPLDEQVGIAAFLDHNVRVYDELVRSVKSAIERLGDYRAALIADVVTGKIDVRSFAEAREVA